MQNNRVIVTISGGKASAYCAKWAFDNYAKENIILYFNDTLWEDPDLYRFIGDLSKYFDHPITYDSDGRSPEQLFYYSSALANSRWPFCSKILKADRLQNYFMDGDILIFGIDNTEIHRAHRITGTYQMIATKRDITDIKIKFPLISENITKNDIDQFLIDSNIKQPRLYDLGFTHNNCGGGCVRAGKKQWIKLFYTLPEVYLAREKIEEDIRAFLKKDVHFLKDITLRDLRIKLEQQLQLIFDSSEEEELTECIGICNTKN